MGANLVAVGSFDGTLRVGAADTEAVSDVFADRHETTVTALYVADDGYTVISGCGLLPWMAGGANAAALRCVAGGSAGLV